MTRALVTQMLNALEYHQLQTRPIHNTELAIEAAREYLATEPIGERAESIQWLRRAHEVFGNKNSKTIADMLEADADLRMQLARRTVERDMAISMAISMLVADAQQATHDIKALQSNGKGPAPCARFCEANAFQIEIRRLKAEINAQQAKRVPMTCQEADAAWSRYVSDEFFTHEDLIRLVEAHHDITPAEKPTDWSAA